MLMNKPGLDFEMKLCMKRIAGPPSMSTTNFLNILKYPEKCSFYTGDVPAH